MKTLEVLCLDKVTSLIPILGTQMQDLPVYLLQCILPRCNGQQLALIHGIAIQKGLDTRLHWQELCKKEFGWYYRYKLCQNLHDPHWLCAGCQKILPIAQVGEDIDWHQAYQDKKCEGSLLATCSQHFKPPLNSFKLSVDKEIKRILQNPLDLPIQQTYCPVQLLLDGRTIMALTECQWNLDKLSRSLQTLMCRIPVPRKFCDRAAASLEKLVDQLLMGEQLRTFCMKEVNAQLVDYSRLFDLLLLGRTYSNLCNAKHVNTVDKPSSSSLSSPSSSSSSSSHDFDNDLYNFCFKEPVKADFLSDNGQANENMFLHSMDLYCEEGFAQEDVVARTVSSPQSRGVRRGDNCFHYLDPDENYFNHMARVPDTRTARGWAISNLVLVCVQLTPRSCTALANSLACCSKLHSFSIHQCALAQCGLCEIMSALAAGAQKNLHLKELYLNCAPVVKLNPDKPRVTFGQYCMHKLTEMLQSYHSKNHKMERLKLDLQLSIDCQVANNFPSHYASSIRHLSLKCWAPAVNLHYHPLSYLMNIHALVTTSLSSPDSILTSLVLDNAGLTTEEVEMVLLAASKSLCIRRISMQYNNYKSSKPNGLLALLKHPKLYSLDIGNCEFLLRDCDEDYQEAIVKAFNNNRSLQHLSLLNRRLDDKDLKIMSRSFSRTERTVREPGYCLYLGRQGSLSISALEEFATELSNHTLPDARHNRRLHSLDHLTVAFKWSFPDARYTNVIRKLRDIIPHVNCPNPIQ